MPTFTARFGVTLRLGNPRKLLIIKDLRPLGVAIEATLVSVAFSYIYEGRQNPLGTY